MEKGTAMLQQVVDHSASSPPGLPSAYLPPWGAIDEPGRVFAHPNDVVAARDLSREEKRSLLASWASDVRAIESAPGLRQCPGLPGRCVPVEAVLEALRSLDPEAAGDPCGQPEPANRARKAGVRWPVPKLSRMG